MRGTVRHRSRRGLSPRQAGETRRFDISRISPPFPLLSSFSSATIHCNPAVDAYCIVPNTKAKPNLRCLPSQFLRALVCFYCRVCGSICAHARKPFCPFALLLLDPPRGPQCELSIHSSIDQSINQKPQSANFSVCLRQQDPSRANSNISWIHPGRHQSRVESASRPRSPGPQIPVTTTTTWPELPLCHIIKPSGDPQKSSGRGRT